MTFLDDDNILARAKRAMAPLGQYSTVWPGSTDAELAGALADGFSMAQLDGFFGTYSLDIDSNEITPDLTEAGISLVISYMAASQLRAKILTLTTASRYKAGPVEYETTPLATVLTALLETATANIRRLLNGSTAVTPIWTDGTIIAAEAGYLSPLELPSGVVGLY